MIIKETHLVPEGICNVRLSDYAQLAFPVIPSRKGIAKAIKRGEIRINGAVALSGRWVEAGQTLELIDPQKDPPKIYRLPLEVIFEDDDLAVINKPAGIEVSGNKFKTIENALAGSLTPSPRRDALPFPRPVHRLDYATSGLLIIAKTIHAQIFLSRQFEERNVHKKYCAVVMGRISTAGTIEEPTNGLAALSRYDPVKTIKSLRSTDLTLVHLFPITGRTHQLRIHMAHIGHPIVGDQKYGQTGNVLKGKGIFLAAVGLHLQHPRNQHPLSFAIDSPCKFESLLAREQSRWEKFTP